MDKFFKYADAAQKAVRIGVTSAHKEFFQNLDTNSTKLEFVVGEEQSGGGKKLKKINVKSRFKKSGKSYGPYKEYNNIDIKICKRKKSKKKKQNNKYTKKIKGIV